MQTLTRNWFWIIALCGLPQIAAAHLVSTRFGEFYSGLLHPLTTLLHLVPWIAFGLVAGSQKLQLARWSLLIFPGSIFLGVFLGSLFPIQTFFASVNLITFGAGLLAALAVRLSKPIFLALFAVFGVCHGIANGVDNLAGSQLLLYACGVTLAGYLLITFITTAAHCVIHRFSWGQIAVRALGSWIVAVGLLFGGYLLLVQS